jgi:hypothetical protein
LLLILLPAAWGWAQAPRDQWRRLSPEEKAAIERNYQRWQSLPPERQEHLRKEWDYWRNLPPDRQENLKRGFQAFSDLPPNERQQWQDKFQRRQLSPEEKRALRDRLRPKDKRFRPNDGRDFRD